jgi:DinB family protein
VTQDPDITPDDRDWTYVIREGCRECGFVPQDPETTGDRLRAAIPVYREALAGEAATRRPEPTVWSAAEYGCHVRDASRIFRERLELMLSVDDPVFANWDQDATAIEEGYARLRPDVVAAELAREVSETAAAFDAVQPEQWTRPGRRSNGSAFTVATFAVYFLHDIEHHVHDVRSSWGRGPSS